MTKRELKRRARRETLRARVISDGCRDYVIEIEDGEQVALLRRRRGRCYTMQSLQEAATLLKRCGVRRAVLRQRVAHDEAATSVSSPFQGFSELPLEIAG